MDVANIPNDLIVRPITECERSRWIELCNEHHYLGFKGCFGYSIAYCACVGSKWVALLSWGSCALTLKPRDEWIGWSTELRKVRSNWIVNNNRFVTTMRNLSIGIMRLGGSSSNIAEGIRESGWNRRGNALRAIGLS